MGNMKSSYIDKIKTSFPIEDRYRMYGMYASSDITFENVNIERVKKLKYIIQMKWCFSQVKNIL